MPDLPITLQHHQSPRLAEVLNEEIRQLPAGTLPLHRGTTQGGYVDETDIRLSVLAVSDDGQVVNIKSGVFFTEIVINCGCGDDPVETSAYCEMLISIDKATAGAAFEVLPEDA
jgi:hypothetical protein